MFPLFTGRRKTKLFHLLSLGPPKLPFFQIFFDFSVNFPLLPLTYTINVNTLSSLPQEKAVNLLDSMAAFMTQTVKNKSSHNEELVEKVGTALLNGMGNLLDITAYEAKENRSEEDESLIAITNERREKVKKDVFFVS